MNEANEATFLPKPPINIGEKVSFGEDASLLIAIFGYFKPVGKIEVVDGKIVIPPTESPVLACEQEEKTITINKSEELTSEHIDRLELNFSGITSNLRVIFVKPEVLLQLRTNDSLQNIQQLGELGIELRQEEETTVLNKKSDEIKVKQSRDIILIDATRIKTQGDWLLLIDVIKRTSGQVAQKLVATAYNKTRKAFQNIDLWQSIIDKIECSDFHEEFSPLPMTLNSFKQFIRKMHTEISDWQALFEKQFTLDITSDDIVKFAEPSSASNDQIWHLYSINDIANKLYAIGLKEDTITRLTGVNANDLSLASKESKTRRLTGFPKALQGDSKYTQKLMDRYGNFIKSVLVNPKNDLFADLLFLSESLQKDIPIEILLSFTNHGLKTLLDGLPISEAMKALYQTIDSNQLPITLGKWLERVGFTAALDALRHPLRQIESLISLLPEEKLSQYESMKKSVIAVLDDIRKKQILINESISPNKASTYPLHPLFGIFDEQGVFDKEIVTKIKDIGVPTKSDLFKILEKEFYLRSLIASKEHECLENVLSAQSHHNDEGYPGWQDENIEDYFSLFESAPQYITHYETMCCVGRSNFILGVMDKLGIKNGTFVISGHIFTWMEDALGVPRIIEPSNYPYQSHYPKELEMFTHDQLSHEHKIISVEMPDVNKQLNSSLYTADKRLLTIALIESMAEYIPPEQQIILFKLALKLTEEQNTDLLINYGRILFKANPKYHAEAIKYIFKGLSLDTRQPKKLDEFFIEHFEEYYAALSEETLDPNIRIAIKIYLEAINQNMDEEGWEKLMIQRLIPYITHKELESRFSLEGIRVCTDQEAADYLERIKENFQKMKAELL